MSKLDKIKEEIGWLKIIFAALLAIDISLVAWVAQNFNRANIQLLISALIAVSVVTVFLIIINLRVYRKLDEMEEL